MQIIFIILLVALLISLTSFAGALLTAKMWRRIFDKEQALIVSFAAGVFLLLGVFLLTEAIELLEPVKVALYFGGSLLLFHILSLIWPEHHHHHGEEECKQHSHDYQNSAMASRMLVSDGVHNIADGLILVPAFMAGTEFGLITAFGIWVHELVQEVAEYAVLRRSGYSVKKALTLNFFSSLTIFIGIIMALTLVGLAKGVEGPLAAIAAGSFLYVSLKDLIPHSVRHSHRVKRYGQHAAAVLVGAALIVILNVWFGHGHVDDDHRDYFSVESRAENHGEKDRDDDHLNGMGQ